VKHRAIDMLDEERRVIKMPVLGLHFKQKMAV
jgi:hypothetical protein